tara:strand:- start:232 stop:738 length:507 start_codon:yes stop_codon:yes gene_type:complete
MTSGEQFGWRLNILTEAEKDVLFAIPTYQESEGLLSWYEQLAQKSHEITALLWGHREALRTSQGERYELKITETRINDRLRRTVVGRIESGEVQGKNQVEREALLRAAQGLDSDWLENRKQTDQLSETIAILQGDIVSFEDMSTLVKDTRRFVTAHTNYMAADAVNEY